MSIKSFHADARSLLKHQDDIMLPQTHYKAAVCNILQTRIDTVDVRKRSARPSSEDSQIFSSFVMIARSMSRNNSRCRKDRSSTHRRSPRRHFHCPLNRHHQHHHQQFHRPKMCPLCSHHYLLCSRLRCHPLAQRGTKPQIPCDLRPDRHHYSP